MTIDDLLQPHDPELLGDEGMAALRAQVVAFWNGRDRLEIETTLRTWHGRQFPALLQGVLPAVGNRGDFGQFMVWISDQTTRAHMMDELRSRNAELERAQRELGQMQKQAVRSEKLEAIGSLAAGIAHEINTPIQYIGDNSRFLQEAFGDFMKIHVAAESLAHVAEGHADLASEVGQYRAAIEHSGMDFWLEEAPSAIAQTLEGVEHVATIVRALKEFSHPGTGEKEPVDLNAAIESAVELSRNEWKYVADLEVDLDRDLPLIEAFSGKLKQVILNLIVNAAQAIGENRASMSSDTGRITITTRRAGEDVEVAVADTGGGIPEEIRDRIFDPFFTTKPVGQGTGQGLAITHKVIVEMHGGSVDVTSDPGVGTTFTLRLPVHAEGAP